VRPKRARERRNSKAGAHEEETDFIAEKTEKKKGRKPSCKEGREPLTDGDARADALPPRALCDLGWCLDILSPSACGVCSV